MRSRTGLARTMKAILMGICCSLDFSSSCRQTKIISEVLRSALKPHWDSGRTLLAMCSLNLASRILANTFMECWDRNEVPTQWKLANMITIYKRKGEKSDCSNYRGLSLLDVAEKVFTRVKICKYSSLFICVSLNPNLKAFSQILQKNNSCEIARVG